MNATASERAKRRWRVTKHSLQTENAELRARVEKLEDELAVALSERGIGGTVRRVARKFKLKA